MKNEIKYLIDLIDWHNLFMNKNLLESFTEIHKDRINSFDISCDQKTLSEDFIERHKKFLDKSILL